MFLHAGGMLLSLTESEASLIADALMHYRGPYPDRPLESLHPQDAKHVEASINVARKLSVELQQQILAEHHAVQAKEYEVLTRFLAEARRKAPIVEM